MKAPLPSNETARLQALSKYAILDTPMESVFDDLTRLAAYICSVPTSTISLVDRDRQWFKSKIGLEICETSRDVAFCAHGILQLAPLIIPDTQQDERFADNPLVTGAPHIRFYAGVPLIDPDGFALGTLCVIDYVPRQLSNQQIDALVVLARQVMTQLTLRRNLVALQESTTQCQLADVGLQQMVRFQQGILDGANYSIISTTTDGIIQTVNAATESWLGYTTTELIGQTPALFHDEAEVVHYARELSQEMGTTIEPGFEVFVAKARCGQADEREWTYIRADSSCFPVMLSVTALRDDKDNITGFIGIAKDISEQKQAAAALRESEKLFKAVFDQAFQFIGLLASDGTVLEVNQTFLDFGEVTLREVVGQLFWETPWWRHSLSAQEQLKYAISQVQVGDPVRYEVEFVAGDTKITLDFSIKPVKDETGKVVLLLLEGRDISDRKQIEEALRSSVATNQALINALPDLMFRISTDGTFVNFKASKTHTVPMLPEEFLGKTVWEVMSIDVAQLTMNGIDRAISTGELQIFECQMLLDDNICHYETRIAVSAKDEAMVIVRDITRRKQAEIEIRNALETEKHLSELKSRFVTMTSHEFRTPLTTILSSAELIEDFGDLWSKDKKHLHLNRIKVNVTHMTQLLDDVMLIGKEEVGKLDCHPTKIDVVEFCRNLVDEIHPGNISNHHIAFVSQTTVLPAYLDEKLLRHILSNLVSNAIKYSPSGGTINFYLGCQNKEVSFQIQDRGIGIPPKELEHLFSSFYRASNVGNISGTGLGLAIVKKAVDLHQGNIAVESELGVGTTFLVSIPLKQEEIYEQNFSN